MIHKGMHKATPAAARFRCGLGVMKMFRPTWHSADGEKQSAFPAAPCSALGPLARPMFRARPCLDAISKWFE